ncbi:hypothetical protein RKK60_000909 [Enterobacter hormaechei]|nr:hypothetical protein [Enterobacter hormaechei]
MSSRSDIIGADEWQVTTRSGLVYSEVLGWIDLGHARGEDISLLLADFSSGEASGRPYYTIAYNQRMNIGKGLAGTGKFVRWEIKRGRSMSEINSIALAMMMDTARNFENYQSRAFFSWYTDSGFSGEDLVSDLLGFYRALIPSDYRAQLRPVSRESALRRWDHYGPIGNFKNRGFLPLIFPDPNDLNIRHEPYKGPLPRFMRWVTPFDNFSSDIVRILNDNGTYHSFFTHSGRR